MDSGHVAWMLTASALVLLMTPGLAFFYGGLVRARNVVSTIMYSFVAMAVVSVVWVLWGYSFALEGGNAFIGDFSKFGLSGIDINSGLGDPDNPAAGDLIFVVFQMMFAIITPALITGAFVERFKFTTYMIFLVLWVTLVYAPIAHWVWDSDGWLFKMGALDFAGGTVVHINAGLAAVAAALLVGKRRNPGPQPHNVPYVVLGAALLWFGWFGFNAGSEVLSDGIAVSAWTVTNTATGMASVTWLLMSWAHTGRPSIAGAATGAVAGLVAITPASGWVGPMAAIIIGVAAGTVCYGAVAFKNSRKWDDALDVWGVHGIGGFTGAVLTGTLASPHVWDTGDGIGAWTGTPEGMEQQAINIAGACLSVAYAFSVTIVILKIMDVIWPGGIRVTPKEEEVGLDIAQNGERAYVNE